LKVDPSKPRFSRPFSLKIGLKQDEKTKNRNKNTWIPEHTRSRAPFSGAYPFTLFSAGNKHPFSGACPFAFGQ
jgi:hypothetical protein